MLTPQQKCVNINAENVNVKAPSGKTAQWLCVNLGTGKLDINCVTKVTKS